MTKKEKINIKKELGADKVIDNAFPDLFSMLGTTKKRLESLSKVPDELNIVNKTSIKETQERINKIKLRS